MNKAWHKTYFSMIFLILVYKKKDRKEIIVYYPNIVY